MDIVAAPTHAKYGIALDQPLEFDPMYGSRPPVVQGLTQDDRVNIALERLLAGHTVTLDTRFTGRIFSSDILKDVRAALAALGQTASEQVQEDDGSSAQYGSQMKGWPDFIILTLDPSTTPDSSSGG